MNSSRAYHLSRLIREGADTPPYVFLAENGREALKFKRDLEFFLGPYAGGEVFFFPPLDVLPTSHLSPHNDILCDRLKVLKSLTRATPPAMIITTVTAILPFLPPLSIFKKTLQVHVGEDLDRDRFLKTLTEWGYQNVPLVLDRGNFAIRGAIVDLFSPLDDHPIRLEWLGDTVESIRAFDPKTQRTLTTRENFLLIPIREILLDDEGRDVFSEKIRAAADWRDLQRSDWFPLLEKVKAGIPFPGIETYLPLFYEKPTTFWDWLPKNAVVVSDNFSALSPLVEEHLEEIRTLMQGKPSLLDITEIRTPLSFFQEKIKEKAQPFAPLDIETHEGIRIDLLKSLEPLGPLAKKIREWSETDSVSIVASSEHQAERIRDLLSRYFSEPVKILIGELSSGFRLPSERITWITEEEIFGKKIRRSEKSGFKGIDVSSFAELKVGDPIVHKEYGIGLYRGLIHMTIDAAQSDFMLITYQGDDKLYLPVYRMNLVQRYTGAEGKMPRLDKMGGTSWAKIRGKAEKIIREIAGELLNLYAARSSGKGFAYSPPNELFEAFEASFPYEETPDQDQAIQDVLKDMQKEEPTDRLVLGDVGYGKTEVALRAAFKAALDGKQTAILVPTTLLALQHHERFVERFKDTPVTVEMLSRFRSAAEQKKIIQEVAQGRIDILIGTHRLLQPDISFKDLGLLIIDEEHRFGVEHKEKVKRLKKDVDVLALSATPIPRTLYMSLVGIRKISIIETPPTDRLAIRTFVMPFQDEVIHEAIVREIKRGGQIFFVHNEVQTIGKMKEQLQALVPEARIIVGHGQMDGEELENVMIQFFHREFDILLCTTIIESGIDIPNANTILINHTQNFGLAQIYQLRGRVGRGNHRAYAYLLVDEDKSLTKDATQRLSVLQRFSELGSGYKMASYDLEIRGAGNLLGTDQAGQITAIGYELYTELMEQAVKELKGEQVLQDIDPELHFRISSYVPKDFVPDPSVRLELYRRLSSLKREEDADPIEAELQDRFGPLPPEVENLLELSAIKALAKRLRIKQIRYDGKHFVYAFDPSAFRLAPAIPRGQLREPVASAQHRGENPDSPPRSPPIGVTSLKEKLQPGDLLTECLVQKIRKNPKRYRLTPDFRFIVTSELPKESLALLEVKKFLRELGMSAQND